MLSPAPRHAWRAILSADPHSTPNQTPEWADAVRSSRPGAQDASRLYRLDDGRSLLLPLMRRSPVPGLTLHSSYPYGDLLASGGLRASDVRVVLDDLAHSHRTSRTLISAGYANAEHWELERSPWFLPRSPRVHVLDLEGGFQQVWEQRFHSSARRAVRKAERSALTVERDTTGRLTSTFYQLAVTWTEERAREAGMPGWLAARTVAGRHESLQLFESVAALLGTACRQWVAWHGGTPVAAIITLVHGEHALYWRGYSDKTAAGPLRANNLLQKMAIEDACASGCRFYSMGQSGGVESLERFKESLGATPRSAPELLLERFPVTALQAVKTRARSGHALLSSTSWKPRWGVS